MSAVRILLTGGSGFVGSAILQQVLERHSDWKLTVADVLAPNSDFTATYGVEYVKLDVRDDRQCLRAIRDSRPDLIIHTAGKVPGGLTRYGKRGKDELFALNVGGTRNMLEAAQKAGVANFLFTGSCTSVTDDLDHEYPNFTEDVPFPVKSLLYGESKAAAEKLVIAANCEKMATCSLRPSLTLGREDYQLVPSIQACIEKWETPFMIGNGDNLYDFTFVDNVAYAHVLAAENLLTSKTAAGQAILISNDQPITFRDFMLAIWAQFDHVPPFTVSIPGPLATAFGHLAEWAAWIRGAKTTLSSGSVKDALGTRYANQEKAKRLLGYAPIVDMWDAKHVLFENLTVRFYFEKIC